MVLPEGELNFLLEHAMVRRYRRGDHLFHQGDEATCLFIVLEGEVEVFIENGQADRTIIDRRESGALFGELELLSGQDRIASAVALTDATLGVIRRCVFEECRRARPQLLAAVARDLAVAFGEIMRRLSTLPLDAYGRLRYYLTRLARETNGSMVVQGLWTQQQLAELAGCRRETAQKILCELSKGGWIRCDRRQITILRPLPEEF
jgi:CRP/FNR family transcriptional regulator, cyclic AMP receptor protein